MYSSSFWLFVSLESHEEEMVKPSFRVTKNINWSLQVHATATTNMGTSDSLTSPRRRWCVLLVIKIALMGLILGARRVKCDDQMEGPETGLLCISECATCPTICSPPPPPLLTSFPPPPPSSHNSPPPQSYYHSPPSSPPPPPLPPPKQSSHSPPPQASSWYPSWGIPPPPNNNNTPKSRAPPMQGPQNNYPYPYYYFYASDASSVSVHASIFVSLMMFFYVLYLI